MILVIQDQKETVGKKVIIALKYNVTYNASLGNKGDSGQRGDTGDRGPRGIIGLYIT